MNTPENSERGQPLAVPLSDQLGPPVPDSVLAYLHAYGDSRADEDGRSGLRIGEAILALRRWAAEVQVAERERCAISGGAAADAGMDGAGVAAAIRGA